MSEGPLAGACGSFSADVWSDRTVLLVAIVSAGSVLGSCRSAIEMEATMNRSLCQAECRILEKK